MLWYACSVNPEEDFRLLSLTHLIYTLIPGLVCLTNCAYKFTVCKTPVFSLHDFFYLHFNAPARIMKATTKKIRKFKMPALLSLVDCRFGWEINPSCTEKWMKSVHTKPSNIKATLVMSINTFKGKYLMVFLFFQHTANALQYTHSFILFHCKTAH